jgi:hypothetical protein
LSEIIVSESVRAVLQITGVSLSDHAASVAWTLAKGEWRYLSPIPFEVAYRWRSGEPVEFGASGKDLLEKTAVFAFLSLLIPTLCYTHREVEIELPFPLREADEQHWHSLVKRLHLQRATLTLRPAGERPPLRYLQRSDRPDRVGLLYGGGVESTAALAKLLDHSPLLFAMDGPGWMNNNTTSNVSIKRDLEKRLCERFKLDMVYSETNARALSGMPEPMLHYYCTGEMFYWLATAVGLRLGISQFYMAQELEYTLVRENWDLSLTPDQLFSCWHPEGPLVVPILGWATKVELVDYLRETELLEYIYSCMHNGETRWCGKCAKCYRLSLSCQMLGIPLKRIGMEAPATGTSEGSQLRRLYWWTADHLYPQPGSNRARHWQLPLTEIALSDVAGLSFFDTIHGRTEKHGDGLVVTPDGDERAELCFPHLRLRGHDHFSCDFRPGGEGSWEFSVKIHDQAGDLVAGWSQRVTGAEDAAMDHSFDELYGEHNVTLSAEPLSTVTSEAPVWYLPLIYRASLQNHSSPVPLAIIE